MKTVTRIVLVAVVAGVLYFATIGNKQFYELLTFFSDVIQAFADNYIRK
jgi:hypothetical protein